MTLGERIKQKRKEKGLTQLLLAKIIGVHQPRINHWESGTIPALKHMPKLIETLKIPKMEFIRAYVSYQEKKAREFLENS